MVLTGQLTYAESEQAFFFWAVPNPSNTSALANSFSVIRPDFSGYNLATVRNTMPTQFNPFNGHSEASGFAGGFQDNISILDERVIGVVGARYDNVRSTTYTFHSAQSIAQRKFVADPASTRNITNQEWTFKYGLVGKPVRGTSIFGQIGQTYIPVNSLNTAGVKNPNQEGEIRELGVKLDLLGSRLVATASVFEMELTNVLVSVPNPPELGGGLVSVPAGKQKTDGFEIDLAWEPTPGLNLSLGYSDLTSTNEAGRSFRGVPIDATWSAMAKYGFRQGQLKGLFVGASWKHNGTSAGDANNTFFLDQSDVFDGFVGFGRGRWSAQLNVFNLTNSDDPITAVGDNAVFRVLDRSYRMTLRYSF
jgi:outer membrane receptor protein involved in Fe transport